ncbi:MAG: RNA recognition motif domain-containing protein [Candidatus Paceibacterota bacterium]
MKNKIYVGNLPYSIDSEALKNLFTEFGEIKDARVITDRDSGRSKGFGFVEFATDEEAQKAIDAMNEKEIEGRKFVVNVARPMRPRENRRSF